MKHIVVNSAYRGEFAYFTALEPTVITKLMVKDRDVLGEFITDPSIAIAPGALITNDITGENYFTEIEVNGSVLLAIKLK
jgi:hypothetical protein